MARRLVRVGGPFFLPTLLCGPATNAAWSSWVHRCRIDGSPQWKECGGCVQSKTGREYRGTRSGTWHINGNGFYCPPPLPHALVWQRQQESCCFTMSGMRLTAYTAGTLAEHQLVE